MKVCSWSPPLPWPPMLSNELRSSSSLFVSEMLRLRQVAPRVTERGNPAPQAAGHSNSWQMLNTASTSDCVKEIGATCAHPDT
jgi:hypothetical protein